MTRRFTKAGPSKPNCLNLPEITPGFIFPCLDNIAQGLLCICLPIPLMQHEANGYLHLSGYLQGYLALKHSWEQHHQS